MNLDNIELTRRGFLTKAAVVASATSIISIEALSKPNTEINTDSMNAVEVSKSYVDPVTENNVNILTNKTIPSRQNTLGTDYINIREYPIDPVTKDITLALNAAISDLDPATGKPGGQILIPHGIWNSSGGQDFGSSISIEGVGFNGNPGISGTEIKYVGPTTGYMFRMKTGVQHATLKNLAIDMRTTSAVGVLLTDHENGNSFTSLAIYSTCLENVGFNGGAFGIKVDSKVVNTETKVSTNFECILNRFERLSFIGCQTSFFCNSINGGYAFDSCYFSLAIAGTALECVFMGNLSVENSLFVGNQSNNSGTQASDQSTILKTTGAFNNISFNGCQDENVHWTYRNTTATNNYLEVPVVFRNCLIQSRFRYFAPGSVILDSCRVGVGTNGAFEDTATGNVRVFLKGGTGFYTPTQLLGGNVGTFTNSHSQVIYESKEVGIPAINNDVSPAGYYIINATRGTIMIPAGSQSVTIYNNLIASSDTLIFAQTRQYDPNGSRIREVQTGIGYFVIVMTAVVGVNLSIGFKVYI